MSAFHINNLFRDLSVDDHLLQRYRENPQAIMREFNLSQEEQNYINSNDFPRLLSYGVNPNIIMRIKDANRVSMSDLMKGLNNQEH